MGDNFVFYAPEAIGPSTYDEKYLIVESSGSPRSFTMISLPLGYHSEILEEYRSGVGGYLIPFSTLWMSFLTIVFLFNNRECRPRGGGILRVDFERRVVSTYGKSHSYGKPDIQVVERILRAAFPDFTVDAQVSDYVRG